MLVAGGLGLHVGGRAVGGTRGRADSACRSALDMLNLFGDRAGGASSRSSEGCCSRCWTSFCTSRRSLAGRRETVEVHRETHPCEFYWLHFDNS